MKSLMILASALILGAGALPASEVSLFDPAAPEFAASEGGGCQLPDLTGLSDLEILAAIEGTGVEARPGVAAQAPLCPTLSQCSSIANCGINAGSCSSVILGPCCTTSSGLGLCCLPPKNIVVTTCNCTCTANPCAIACAGAKNVGRRCV